MTGNVQAGLVLLFAYLGVPRWRALCVAARLLLSKEVVIRSYLTPELSLAEVLTEKPLSRLEMISLMLVFVSPQSWHVANRCLFSPHHDIQMISASGVKSTAVICFGCQMMKLYSQPDTDSSISNVGGFFDKLLKTWFRLHGIPVK